MSVKVMQSVWEHSRASGPALLVMLAIADNANDQGVAWPAVDTIAKKARCSTRTVQRIFADLTSKLGELRIEKSAARAGCNRYVITLGTPRQVVTPPDNLSPRQVVTGDIAVSPGGVTQLCHGGGDIAMSPEPSLNRQLEPSRAGGGDNLSGVTTCQGGDGSSTGPAPDPNLYGETVVDTKSLDYRKADALLDHLIAATKVAYPKSRAALDAAAHALRAVGQDLDGAKRTVTRQVALLLPDVKKASWLRPGTLFERERFANAYAERDLPFAGQAAGGPSGRMEQLRRQLMQEPDPQKRADLRREIEQLEKPAA